MIAIYVLVGTAVALALSAYSVRQAVTVDGFFAGRDGQGHAPDLCTLILSQVTTWIFARSLLNSAILGYYYGVAGSLAYTAYYLSFLTGGYAVMKLRARRHGSVQDWLHHSFGPLGVITYNVVIALRLLSEVFANLLVIGLIFSVLMPQADGIKTLSILAVAGLTLVYSAWGGLRASLKTDVLQMILFAVVFSVAFAYMIVARDCEWSAMVPSGGTSG